MYNSINLERCTKYIQTIVNNIRCVLCDKIEGTRIRYPCGHVACSDCGAVSTECSICITPLTTEVPLLDVPLSQRVRNISALIKSYHEVFSIDGYAQEPHIKCIQQQLSKEVTEVIKTSFILNKSMYYSRQVLRRPRISEQLKIEKELFPNCIQAPTKYFNKRRSWNISQNKSIHKLTLLPGEEVTIDNIEMENSKKYVEQWLLQQEKINTSKSRQPFASLNVNTARVSLKTKAIVKKGLNKIKNTSKESIKNNYKSSRKRKHDFKTTVTSEEQSSSQYLRPLDKSNNLGWNPKKHKWEFDSGNYMNELEERKKNKNNIELETFVIEDTQNEVLDKDKLALIAVHEADKSEIYTEPDVNLHCSEIVRYTDDIERAISNGNDAFAEVLNRAQKVPFFKKDIILEKCSYCKEDINKSYTKIEKNLSNDVTITVENQSLITIINLSDYVKNNHKLIEKKNTAIQTDICEAENMTVNGCKEELNTLNYIDALLLERGNTSQVCTDTNNSFNKPSQDLFVQDINCSKQSIEKVAKQLKHMKDYKLKIVEESDSDFENENKSLSQFTQSVPGVLFELEQNVIRSKARNSLRRRTPTSTDSSDKENRDPNRKKVHKLSKKSNKKNKL